MLSAHLAFKSNFVDCPDGRRKIQKAPVALGGGVAIYLSVLSALYFLWMTWDMWDWGDNPDRINRFQILLLLAASGLLCAVGMYDDRFHIRGRTKLIWQIVACTLVVCLPGGIMIKKLTLFGEVIPLGAFGSKRISWLAIRN